jgi:hypothetical protein
MPGFNRNITPRFARMHGRWRIRSCISRRTRHAHVAARIPCSIANHTCGRIRKPRGTRARPAPAIVTSPESFEAASFAIQDVEVSIAFPGEGFEARADAERRRIYDALQAHGEFGVVWRDPSGGKKFLCAPQQQRFYECARYDQLAAQINRTISIP